jgi:uncharacterized protein YkwD
MRKGKKIILFAVFTFFLMLCVKDETILAKTSKVTMNLTGAKKLYKYPAALEKAKKVTVKSSKKSVVRVKYKKTKKVRRIVLTARKYGTATVTVKCKMQNKKTKTYKYKVKVVKAKKVTDLDKAKKAFKIQNQYRKEKGVAALEWSDELYQFCLYRLKTSGFDRHENLDRDTLAYFGFYTQFKKLGFGENQHSGYSDPKSAMKSWKNSERHYQNILSSNYVCGAIACYKNTWIAIFYDGDKSEVENWRDYKIKEITVKRYDSASATYIGDCAIGYYEADDRWGSLQAATIAETTGKKLYLEIGKTYVIYERKMPNGCNPTEKITITVTEDGVSEVVLSS